MDTDSSIPPLLLLTAALLLFAWARAAAATRRDNPPLATLLAQVRSPGTGVLQSAAAVAAGGSTLALALNLAAGWPPALLLLAVIPAVGAALAVLRVAVDRWAARFPGAARRVSNPRRWVSGAAPPAPNKTAAPANGDAGPDNGLAGEPARHDHADHPEPLPLTPAEILNLDHHDIDMVRSISRMDDRDALDIMVPRLDVDAVSVAASLDELIAVFVATKHSRLPVYRNTMDDVVGIVHISDVLHTLAEGRTDASLDSIMRTAYFVIENMAVDDLLRRMRSHSLQMTIVVDEYGGVEGIVTLEDVLDEIVGAEPMFAAADGSWLVNPTMPVEEVTQAVGITLDCADVNTIGGYVYTRLGRMPTTGDVVDLESAGVPTGLSIEVMQVRGRRIQQLRLAPAGTDAPPDGSGPPDA